MHGAIPILVLTPVDGTDGGTTSIAMVTPRPRTIGPPLLDHIKSKKFMHYMDIP
jgi:hypothetical protein